MTITTAAGATDTLRWEPPAKGDWRGLHDHFPRALTPEYQRLLARGMTDGEAQHFAAYGLPARTIEPAFVHGRVFVSAAPLVGPRSDRVPPTWAMWLAVRAVPAFRRRERAAARALAGRRWLAEADRWYQVERPAWEDRNNALDAVDPATLDGPSLVEHLGAARANAQAGYLDHFRLHGADLLPTGLFLARAADWGIDPHDASELLAGSSPASRGGGELPAWRLVTGYDLDERCAAELPDLPAAPGDTPPAGERPAVNEAEARMRAQVPDVDQEEWSRLLADARATYGVRDDNGLVTGAWPVGLLRRAMLEAGRRLIDAGALHEVEHAVELTVDELVAALEASPGQPSAQEAADRCAERARLSAVVPPTTLGPLQDLPVQAMTPAMGTITRALLTTRDLGTSRPGERPRLTGVGIGEAAVTGRALVAVDTADAFQRFEPGDIVITRGTCPAWNAVLALAGGVVTEEGGPLSHAAIIARELRLPALVGASEAVALVPDGATVELDPAAGRITLVDAP
jgi:rifampicin phosphotransferase